MAQKLVIFILFQQTGSERKEKANTDTHRDIQYTYKYTNNDNTNTLVESTRLHDMADIL